MQRRATEPRPGLRMSRTPSNGYTRALADTFTPAVDGETQKRVGNHCPACWCFASEPCKNPFCLQDGRTSHKIPPRPLDSAPLRFPGCSCRLSGEVAVSFLSSSHFPSPLPGPRKPHTGSLLLAAMVSRFFSQLRKPPACPGKARHGQLINSCPQLLWIPKHVILPICLMAM